MEIIGDMIIFKSVGEFFIKEKTGSKSNTVRMPSYEDRESIIECIDTLTHITIISTDTGENFVRQLTDISIYREAIIFSWRHPLIWM